MVNTYTHTRLNDEVHSIAGYYCPLKEGKLCYNGREVLYILGQATVDNSCCANGCWQYAMVPGYILHWQNDRDDAGQFTSQIEPITDGKAQETIRRLVRETTGVNQVDFR
jgi:hypothetical protein